MINDLPFNRKNMIFFILCLAGILILIYPICSQANSSANILATVKIAVCGDSIIEGSEECDGLELNNQTCETQGFDEGSLSCNLDCSFDKSDCVIEEDNNAVSGGNLFAPILKNKIISNLIQKTIPKKIRGDIDNNNKINLVDFSIMAYWYKKPFPPLILDLNQDNKIDLTDFSILAYYWNE
jgi:hypothetical protein